VREEFICEKEVEKLKGNETFKKEKTTDNKKENE
jgi:hypothetical protein